MDFLPEWAEAFGGVLRDGLNIEEDVDAGGEVLFADVGEFHIEFAHAHTVACTICTLAVRRTIACWPHR